jgi:hypothetical protein
MTKRKDRHQKSDPSLSLVGPLSAAIESGVTAELLYSLRECHGPHLPSPEPLHRITRDQLVALYGLAALLSVWQSRLARLRDLVSVRRLKLSIRGSRDAEPQLLQRAYTSPEASSSAAFRTGKRLTELGAAESRLAGSPRHQSADKGITVTVYAISARIVATRSLSSKLSP